MRRLFVTAFFAMSVAFAAPMVQAGNQEEANQIARNINAAFPQYMVEVAYKDGRVRLQGEVNSEMDRQAIIQMVKQSPNVRAVSDRFRVVDGSFSQPNSPIMTASANMMTPNATNLPAVPNNYNGNYMVASTETPNQSLIPGNYSYQTAPVQSQIMADQGNFSLQADTVSAPNSVYTPAETNYSTPMNYSANYSPAPQSSGYSPAPQGVPLSPGMNGSGGEPNLPNYAWPTTADYPNYAQVGYPKQYAASAFPYIGPFYPYPQVPLGWRKVTMEWHDGYWWLDFNDGSVNGPFSPLFRQPTKYR